MHTEKMMNYVKTAGADALLLLDEADMHYVCGFSPSEGMILVTPTAVYQLVDSRYTETARLHAADTGVQVTEITTGFWDELDALLAKIDCKILLFGTVPLLTGSTRSCKAFSAANCALSATV